MLSWGLRTQTPAPSTGSASCPKCGTDTAGTPDEAQQRIQDLQEQVRALNEKAALTVEKLADYEDEVQALKAQCARLRQQQSQPARQMTPVSQIPEVVESPSPSSNNLQISPPRAASRLATLSSFFTARPREASTPTPTGQTPPLTSIEQLNRSTPNLTSPNSTSESTGGFTPGLTSKLDPTYTSPMGLSLQSLQSTLESERSRRLKAESSLTQTQTELEELTAQLFGQANEMVAAERKARYKLEERVKVLENRDGEKRQRLERLEKALQRIERVRGLVERRNTVNGYGDAADLDIANSDDGNVEKDNLERASTATKATIAYQKGKMVASKVDVRRKAVGGGGSERDRNDRARPKNERKGTF